MHTEGGKESKRTWEAHLALAFVLKKNVSVPYQTQSLGRQRAQPLLEPVASTTQPGEQAGGRRMEGRMHTGLGSETAALWPQDEKPNSAPLFRGLQQDRGKQSPPHGREVRGLSPHLETEGTYSYPRAFPRPCHLFLGCAT